MLIGAEELVAVERGAAGVVRDAAAHVRHSVVLRIAGTACAVHFDDAPAARRFAARYADLTIAGAVPRHHAFALRDPVLGPLFWSDGGPVFRWPHGDLAEHVVAFLADAVALTAFFNERADGVLSLHAATVGIPGAAAAIVGDSDVGKTTTAIACGRIGLRLFSDERCVLDGAAVVHPFPRALNVREPGRALLLRDRVAGPDPVGERLRAHGPGAWTDVRFGELFAPWALPEPAPLRAVFVLAGAGPRVRLDPATTAAAVKAASRWAHGAGRGLDKLARLHDLFGRAVCYRLELGSPDASAHAIRAALTAASGGLGRSA